MKQRSSCLLFLLALVTYFQDVAPILNANCIECHSYGASLNMTNFPFLSKFTDDQMAIVQRILIRAGSNSPSMPPGNRPKLSPVQVSALEQWRDQGLPY